MGRESANKSFGEIIQALRKGRNWTVKELIQRLEKRANKKMSPAYITRIEQYGEIPSPEVICMIADVFNYNVDRLFECARTSKVKKFDESLEEKYRKAVGMYRTNKRT